MPIFDVKPAGETNVLIGPLFDHVGVARILGLDGLDAGRDVGNELIATGKGHWRALMWNACGATATATECASAAVTASSRRCPLLMGCRHCDSRWNEVALGCRLGKKCRVDSVGGQHHHKLLHHKSVFSIALCLVSGDLLHRGFELGGVCLVGCGCLRQD